LSFLFVACIDWCVLIVASNMDSHPDPDHVGAPDTKELNDVTVSIAPDEPTIPRSFSTEFDAEELARRITIPPAILRQASFSSLQESDVIAAESAMSASVLHVTPMTPLPKIGDMRPSLSIASFPRRTQDFRIRSSTIPLSQLAFDAASAAAHASEPVLLGADFSGDRPKSLSRQQSLAGILPYPGGAGVEASHSTVVDVSSGTLSSDIRATFHTLSAESIVRRLQSNADVGLTDAEVATRVRLFGRNEMKGQGSTSGFIIFLKNLFNFMMILLLVAMIFSFVRVENPCFQFLRVRGSDA
jgi:hypothetical protein